MDDEAKVARKPSTAAVPEIAYDGSDYPRISPGVYSVVGHSWHGPQWIRAFSRWGLRVEFATLSGDGNVSRFFNLGSDPEQPYCGRKSAFFAWWCAANGGPPEPRQAMTPDIFLDGQIFEVVVSDAQASRKQDADATRTQIVFSRITELREVRHGERSTKLLKSLKPKALKRGSRQAGKQQSNQARKQPSKEGSRDQQRQKRSNFAANQDSPSPGDGIALNQKPTLKGGRFSSRSGRPWTIH